ncbi:MULTISPECIES: hypothetical protein [unclassified Streptomyces]|uniref:hypothetical protein n=1 Tax=Streptomyces sp. So13.3 TaxID=2136173 RepID=UPI001FD060E7|nr:MULTISPECIES: hypothetical protein [unclassified Streptomyces]MCZ4099725.1 hypothetical protein [Streptomyces sp. H39-C1]
MAAEPAAVAQAAPVSAELVQVAAAAGREPGQYGLEYLALEYQRSRPGPARQNVAPRCSSPLTDARIYSTPSPRSSTVTTTVTAPLCACRSTPTPCFAVCVLYRLCKIAALTGLVPIRASDLPALHAALACRRVAQTQPGAG